MRAGRRGARAFHSSTRSSLWKRCTPPPDPSPPLCGLDSRAWGRASSCHRPPSCTTSLPGGLPMCWWLSPRPTPRTGGGLQLTGVGEGRGGGSACPLLRTDPPQRTQGPWLPQAAAPCPPDLGPRWGSVAGTHARVWHVWWPHTWGGAAHGGIQTRSHSVCLTERRCWARPAEVISRSWVSEPLSSPSPDSSPLPLASPCWTCREDLHRQHLQNPNCIHPASPP